ncbi:hypothetical protein HMPREF1544_02078 [Mucor circinelloides 1006PhL]|uniref:Uncharacterized protein n=1 Tax=Mucor circinelloides f. circinelloides (strain 1006PhL) TaxID=1220926 RepID=S2JM18_MUCC1|nr:hypothetical protein HMPREF1544_02078 [Mucor circinelloides 1006PhL]
MDSKKLEILVLETSGSLENNDKVEINFDHHKAIFGALAMLKTTAGEFRLASVRTFQYLKLSFVHAAESEIHLWSIRFRQNECYELWRECSLEVKPLFEDRVGFVPALIQFFWNMKVARLLM